MKSLEERDRLEDLGLDWKIIIELAFRDGRTRVREMDFAYASVPSPAREKEIHITYTAVGFVVSRYQPVMEAPMHHPFDRFA